MAETHVCPWWIGYFMASPIRRIFEKPEAMIGPHVTPGMTVLDAGCAMGYFSLAAARLVGDEGRVICVDLQERMLRSLRKRAGRAGFEDRIEARRATTSSLQIEDLAGSVDFAMAVHVVHEVPDQAGLFEQIHHALAPSGQLLVAEPAGHVSREDFERSLARAEAAGFAVVDRSDTKRSFGARLRKETRS